MRELNDLVLDCYQKQLENEDFIKKEKIYRRCVGITNQTVRRVYGEAVQKMKNVYLQIIERKLRNVDWNYEEEILYFLEILNYMFNKDYLFADSMPLFKKASRLYVNPFLFDQLVGVAQKEISSFSRFQRQMHKMISKTKEFLEKKIEKRDAVLNKIEQVVSLNPNIGDEVAPHEKFTSTEEEDEDGKI